MRKTSFSTVCVLALLVAGCQNSDDDNRGLEYDTLRVNFKGSMTNGTWETGAEVGIFASCTRNDAQDTPMSENANARYTAATEGESAALAGTTEADAVIADASDHNYRFYAYYPYSGAAADPKAVAAAAPAEQPYTGKANGGLYTASKSVTTVVPTVELQFRNVFAMMELYLPDDLLDEDGNSVVKTLTLKPAVAENFSGALAVSGTYDLTTGTFTENPATRSQQIVVDFGAQGLTLNSAYTKVPLVVAPCTVPEGGFEVAFTDKNDRASSLTILAKAEDAGTALAAGEVSKQYLSAGSDGIIPVTFPVVFPLGYENNLPVFSATTQPQWLTDGLWICPSQTQAHAKWIKASDPSDQYKQKLEYVASNIGSPGIKGIWTGDCFEFTLPVKRFAAGTSVTLTFPMYTRQGPVFWDIEYLDGETWKCNRENVTCYDPAYSMECTYSLVRGGKVIEHTMTFENEVKSGELKFRIKCADGRVQAAAAQTVTEREIPYTDANGYGAPFYFYLAGSDVTSVTFSTN
ncbi:fimbrillin family protein [Alistipes senegalensis]|uniref:fimbrillin family protein n=1 Tax=Alistipes senegalensis TaxID=1288121 RepID=UPI00242E4F0A|nr:fimbrillin family protein [Alistipes senegalensis]MDY4569345.1 fimbrillin family protein [Alistipes senegalensis]